MTPDPPDPPVPPLRLLWGEARSLLALHLGHSQRARPATAGPGAPVLVLPGFLSNDRSTRLLRAGLRTAGLDPHPWGLGRNMGVRADTLDHVAMRVAAIRAGNPAPLTLVGWSLGGLIAREYAKRHPAGIARVVTLGSPFSGDMRNNRVWRLYEAIAGHPVDAPPIACRLSEKPPMDTVALWSRRDGIVGHAPARGLAGEVDRAVELDCSHIGFAVDAHAIAAVAGAVSCGSSVR